MLALLYCERNGGIVVDELGAVCKTEDYDVLRLVTSKLISISLGGNRMLTEPSCLKRYNNARARASGAHALVGGGVLEEFLSENPTLPPHQRARADAREVREVAEKRVTDAVEKIRAALNDEGYALVHKTMNLLTRHRTTQALLCLSTRIEMWETLAKFPAPQVAMACETFLLGSWFERGKDFRYLCGIVKKSALSKYIEERATEQRERGFALEAS